MDITIKNPSSTNKKMEVVKFPCEEETLYEICNRLGIEMTTKANCLIVNSSSKDFLGLLQDNSYNINELNHLMKRLDGFVEKENSFMHLPLLKSLRLWQI